MRYLVAAAIIGLLGACARVGADKSAASQQYFNFGAMMGACEPRPDVGSIENCTRQFLEDHYRGHWQFLPCAPMISSYLDLLDQVSRSNVLDGRHLSAAEAKIYVEGIGDGLGYLVDVTDDDHCRKVTGDGR